MRDLMLEDADFDIVFNTIDFTQNGQDKIILLFSANKDLPKKSFKKLHLAVKNQGLFWRFLSI
ncbi:MAG TPA: hypothetical protein ENO40_00150 [Desulfurella acetivorans]|nr:hypothetical protein [Desulfurella acetivorans]